MIRHISIYVLLFFLTACSFNHSSVSLDEPSSDMNKYSSSYEQEQRHTIITDIEKKRKEDEKNSFSLLDFIIETFILNKDE